MQNNKYKKLIIKIKKIKQDAIFIFIFFVIILFVLCYYKQAFLNVLSFNIEILIMLIPFVLFFCILRITILKKIKLGEFLTVISILLAVLFFSFQITFNQIQERKMMNNKLNAIGATNRYNCSMANDMSINLIDNQSDIFNLAEYITDVYENNMVFYYNVYGKDKGDNLLWALALMHSTNSLIGIVQNLDTGAVGVDVEEMHKIKKMIEIRNSDILNRTKDIKKLLCE